MRCINCGRETEQGYWTSSGFLCSVCSESYGYVSCEGCGLRFPRSRMKDFAGGTFCESCYRGIAPKPAPPKPKAPAKAATPIKLPPKKAKAPAIVPAEFGLAPAVVQAKTSEVLAGRLGKEIEYKERKKDVISTILFAMKDIMRGKFAKKKKYEIEIK